jgi:hypothetical protein
MLLVLFVPYFAIFAYGQTRWEALHVQAGMAILWPLAPNMMIPVLRHLPRVPASAAMAARMVARRVAVDSSGRAGSPATAPAEASAGAAWGRGPVAVADCRSQQRMYVAGDAEKAPLL